MYTLMLGIPGLNTLLGKIVIFYGNHEDNMNIVNS